MRIEVVRPRDLGDAEIARWQTLQSADAETRSPFLSPGWAKIVDSVRPDIRVAVIEDAGRIVGFFPAQRTSRFAAMGCGTPLCDYEGVVGEPNLNVNPVALARALRVDRIDFAFVPTKQHNFAQLSKETVVSHVLDLSGGIGAFFEQRKKEGSSTFRDAPKKRRRMQRELGEVRFEPRIKNAAAFEQMLAWKRAQTERTGQPDIYGRKWVREVLDRVFASDSPDCNGYFMSLYAGDRLIGAMLNLGSQEVAHAWITAYDSTLEQYSPGLVMWMDFLQDAGAQGYKELDYGAGDYRFKVATANVQRPLMNGFAARPSMAAVVRGAEYAIRKKLESQDFGKWSAMPGKAMRRLDVMRGLGVFSPSLK
ncbi:MAG: GNAT family N-acetyltransferase [Caulobacterales bacterium]